MCRGCSLKRGASDFLLDESQRVLLSNLGRSLVNLESKILLTIDAVLVLLHERLIILVLNELDAGSRLVALQLTLVVVVVVVIVEVDVLFGSHLGEAGLKILKLAVHVGQVLSADANSGLIGAILRTIRDVRIRGRSHLALLGGAAKNFRHNLVDDLLVLELRNISYAVLVLNGGHGERSA